MEWNVLWGPGWVSPLNRFCPLFVTLQPLLTLFLFERSPLFYDRKFDGICHWCPLLPYKRIATWKGKNLKKRERMGVIFSLVICWEIFKVKRQRQGLIGINLPLPLTLQNRPPHFQASGGASQCYSVFQWIQSDAAAWRSVCLHP